MKERNLRALLTERGVEWQNWPNIPFAKSIEDLEDEERDGETLVDVEQLMRPIQTVIAHIFVDVPVVGGGSSTRLNLRELKRINGAELGPRPGHEASLSEKIRYLRQPIPETPEQAFLRGLKEEFGLKHKESGRHIEAADLGALRIRRKKGPLQIGPSDAYPGFTTENNLFEAVWPMPFEFYDPNGYKELDASGTHVRSYFRWVNPQGRLEDVVPKLYG